MSKVIVNIPKAEDRRKKSWRKLIDKVDTTKTNGYAFEGTWLRAGEKAELKVGSYILTFDQPGSMKNWYPSVALYQVTTNGLEEVYSYQGKYGETAWALGCRDEIAKIVNNTQDQEDNPLANFSDEEILAEAKKRRLV